MTQSSANQQPDLILCGWEFTVHGRSLTCCAVSGHDGSHVHISEDRQTITFDFVSLSPSDYQRGYADGLAAGRKENEWSTITPDAMPWVDDEVGRFHKNGFWQVDSNFCSRDIDDYRRDGWTHFRPINPPPQPDNQTEAKS